MTLKSLGRSVFGAVALLLAAAAFAQVPSSQHVVLVIDENSSFTDVTANMPWLVGQGDASGYAANYKSDNGGSLLNYLWLASGSCESSANCTLPAGTHDFNCTGNACYYPGSSTSDPITDDNIFRKLNNAGISWKVYAQSYSAAGGKVTTSDNSNGTSYYRRHNGATWYSDVLNNVSGSASKVVDLAQLTTDIASGKLPQFMIIVPDGNHDAHDCPVGMSSCTEAQKLAAADDFLSGTLDPILSTPDFQPGGSGLIIVTFDECGGGTNSGCGAAVYTAVIGPQVAPHTVSQTTYKHENTLRTILDSLGVRTYPGAAASAADMSDFFAANGSKPEVTVSSPASGEVLSSPVVVQASAVPTSGHTVSGWTVYVDSASKYSTGAATAINPTLKISTGTHTILVRAWDTSGAFGDQTFSLTVNQEKPIVTVLTPASGANLGSPVNIQASASPTAGHSITGWWIYLDGTAISNFGSVTSIASNLTMGLGTHSVVVRAWDTSGAYGDQTLTLTASKKPAVVLSKPSAGTNVISPINIQASATPSSGHSITGWWIYLDGVASYQGGAVGSITANIRAATGQHTLLVRAWDSSGAYGDQTISVQVNAVAVNISNPANGASVTSPVNIMANALSPNTLTGWQIYVDSVPSFSQTNGTSVDANVEMNRGTHTLMVRAWNSTGAYGDNTINVTVP